MASKDRYTSTEDGMTDHLDTMCMSVCPLTAERVFDVRCSLEVDHYGVHIVSSVNGEATIWYRNWEDEDMDQDTYRLPIAEDNWFPERRASIDDLIDYQAGASK